MTNDIPPRVLKYHVDYEKVAFDYWMNGRQVFLNFQPKFEAGELSTHLMFIESMPSKEPEQVVYKVVIQAKEDEQDMYHFVIPEPRDTGMLHKFAQDMAPFAVDLYQVNTSAYEAGLN